MLRMRYLAGVRGDTINEINAERRLQEAGGRLPGNKSIKKHDIRNFRGEVSTPTGRFWGFLIMMVAVGLVIYASQRGHESESLDFNHLEEVKWGIIGCGEVTEKKSGPALSLIPRSRLVMVMRRNASLVEDYAKRHGVPRWTTDANELISDSEVNAIYVATPPRYQEEYAMMAAREGKAVYVEKPMGVSYSSGQHLVQFFKKKKVPLFVAYYRRAMPQFLKIRDLISSGAIGRPLSVHIEHHKSPDSKDLEWGEASKSSKLPPGASLKNPSLSWRTDPFVGGRGGHFRDTGSHQLDLLDFWFGPIVSASGSASNEGGLYPTEDTIVANFRFTNGVAGTASWCFVASKGSEREYGEITGSKGAIRFQFFGSSRIELLSDGKEEVIQGEGLEHVQQPMLESVVEALRGIGDCESTGESALRTSLIMDRILEGIPWKGAKTSV